MTDTNYLMQYFLDHSPKDPESQNASKESTLKDKKITMKKKAEDARHE